MKRPRPRKTYQVVLCLYCGKSFDDPKHQDRKYCSRKCFFDHSRIWRRSDKYRQIAIRNLPKGKKKLPDWRGDYRELNRARPRFNREILKRDNRTCRDCGSRQRLEVHHIVSIKSLPEAAFMKMNAVVLCHPCHELTDNFCGRAKGQLQRVEFSTVKWVCKVIPHRWREYNTIGNWSFTPEGILVVFVSDTGNDVSNQAIILHEIIEAEFCRKHNVSEERVTNFDLMYEKEREAGKHREDDEPGYDPRAPYRDWHLVAEQFERAFIEQNGLTWEQHEGNCERIFKR